MDNRKRLLVVIDYELRGMYEKCLTCTTVVRSEEYLRF
jgi:hypothetical protein